MKIQIVPLHQHATDTQLISFHVTILNSHYFCLFAFALTHHLI